MCPHRTAFPSKSSAAGPPPHTPPPPLYTRCTICLVSKPQAEMPPPFRWLLVTTTCLLLLRGLLDEHCHMAGGSSQEQLTSTFSAVGSTMSTSLVMMMTTMGIQYNRNFRSVTLPAVTGCCPGTIARSAANATAAVQHVRLSRFFAFVCFPMS